MIFIRISRIINTIDSHTAGEPTRIVTGGVPYIPGKDMVEKKEWLAGNLDYLRMALLREPRGHKDMVGAVITEPISNDADLGVVFMENTGYLDMCGHGSIGLVTVLLETGMIGNRKDENSNSQVVLLDTPAGKIHTRAKIKNNEVENVILRNVAAFYYTCETLELEGLGKIPVDIAYGGNLFGLVNAKHVHIQIKPGNAAKLVQLSLSIKQKLNEKMENHLPKVNGRKIEIEMIEIYEETSPPRNVVVFGPGQIDRSPCGTGTCAKMALLYEKKKLDIGEPYRYKSIIDTEFVGKIVKETTVENRKAIIPEVTGKAYITGFSQFVIDKADSLRYGMDILL